MGKAIGGVVGGALGTASGLSLGAATSLLIPAVGPVLATGLIGAAILGTGGALGGAAVGRALEDALAKGVPIDEMYVYEEALRQGRTVIVVFVKNTDEEELARIVLAESHAETVDAAREDWGIGLRSAEESHYRGAGGAHH
jgi:hypothetical protein